ncbi:MAG: site-2 protease family protein [Anaerolineaceae bacterium]|nr:site-2 protease family protein [Anaerolineaceae bacterium]
MIQTLGIFLQIIEFIFAFGLLIFIHELGHFLAAKLNGIEVEEFGFGYPPRMFRLFKIKETEYTINWIPFGGFVKVRGENDPEVSDGMASSNPWKRLAIAIAGPIMNLVVGIILFSIIFMRLGMPDPTVVEVIEISPGSPAEAAGLLPGDTIEEINQNEINSSEKLASLIHDNLGTEISIVYQRNDELFETFAVPRENPPEGEGAIGIVMTNPVTQISWFQALPAAALTTVDYGRQLILMPVKLIQGEIAPEQARVVGPKGIFDLYQNAREMDVEIATTEQPEMRGINTLGLLALLSVALGFTNLLPLPALDGGRILFTLPEILFGKRVPPNYENLIHFIGFAALILLMVFVTIQDFVNPISIP